jgi:hypothetical protein
MYVCVVNQPGEILLHEDLPSNPERFLQAIRGGMIPMAYVYHPEPSRTIIDRSNRDGVADKFDDPAVRTSVAIDLELLYEIHDIARFPSVQDFASYARLVKCSRSSSGKHLGTGGAKIGNVHLKWALSEAAVLFLRRNPKAQTFVQTLRRKHGRASATVLVSTSASRPRGSTMLRAG